MDKWNMVQDEPLRQHLHKVYTSVATAFISATGGSLIYCGGYIANPFHALMIGLVGSLIFMFLLAFSHDRFGQNIAKRYIYLNACTFCMGLMSGPMVEMCWRIKPTIVATALLYTCVIFISFSIVALSAPEGKYLFLGGPLLACLCVLLISSIVNIFVRSRTLSYVHIIVGLIIWCAFILYDTHLIIERFRMGDRDFLFHSLILFVDLINLFEDLLRLLIRSSYNDD